MNIVLTFTMMLIGVITAIVGCLVTFGKKFELVLYYDDNKETSKYTIHYAYATGIIEIVGGIIALFIASISTIVSFYLACILLGVTLLVILIPLFINYAIFMRKI